MSIFERIKNAIWGSAQAAPQAAPEAAPPTAAASATAAPRPAAAASGTPPATPSASTGSVDVAAVLDAAVKQSGQKLNWRTSIVDLMKALDLDSSLANRKELAKELGYTGDTADSAAMNIWLHKQVIQKLKDNGGKVPSDLA